jgi:antibiotic biosynthesis monooxygenase (ABM) superfamily enzyme
MDGIRCAPPSYRTDAAVAATGDRYEIRTGLDFWFTPKNAPVKVPTAWKQWLVTWSAILPLSIVVPWVVAPVIAHLEFAHDSFIYKQAAPLKWKYSDPTRRIRCNSTGSMD